MVLMTVLMDAMRVFDVRIDFSQGDLNENPVARQSCSLHFFSSFAARPQGEICRRANDACIEARAPALDRQARRLLWVRCGGRSGIGKSLQRTLHLLGIGTVRAFAQVRCVLGGGLCVLVFLLQRRSCHEVDDRVSIVR